MCYFDYIQYGQDPPEWCEFYMGSEYYCDSLKGSEKKKKCFADRIRPPFLQKKECDDFEEFQTEKCLGTEEHCGREEIAAIYGSAADCRKLRQ
ncbi:hypothetical protein CDD83_4935 [Cordyceps sp. RAO-2017]|nr:hypothetical protein CDD83_4935 [Cordyceps sp. RAO-2017]